MIKKRYMISYMFNKSGLCYGHISVSNYGKLSNEHISNVICSELPTPSTKFIVTSISEISVDKCEIEDDLSI